MTAKNNGFARTVPRLALGVGLLLTGALLSGSLDAASAGPRLETGREPTIAEAEQTSQIEKDKGRVAPERSVAPTEEVDVPSAKPVEIPLRRLLKKEVTRGVARQARTIIDEHHDMPFGSEIAFEVDGLPYVARIEEHYHPPGGEAKPWGHHPGVSVFVRRALPE